MDKQIYEEAREYELLTQAIYQAILQEEGEAVDVLHNVDLKGRSGVEHQCDIAWKFRQGGIEHTVIIECKHYATALNLGHVRSFFGVLHDIGNAQGVMVTKNGFQDGAARFASHYDIGMKLIRPPEPSDWKDRIRGMRVRMMLRWIEDATHGVDVQADLRAGSEENLRRLEAHRAAGTLKYVSGPETRLYDAGGNPMTEELGHWLPRKLLISEKSVGGPYTDIVDTKGLYMRIMVGGQFELCSVAQLAVTYHVLMIADEIIEVDAMNVVKAVLADFRTGRPEYFHRKDS